MAAVGSADGRADGGDFVFRLEGGDVELAVLGQRVQQRRGRRDRVGAEEHRQVGQLRAGDQAERQRLGAGDGAVEAGCRLHRIDVEPVQAVADFGGLAEGMTSIERRDVGVRQHRVLGELGLQPVNQRGAVAVEHPQRQTQRPHVLAADRLLVAKPERLDRVDGELGDVERQQLVARQAAVFQRVGSVAGLGEVAGVELAAVGDDHAALAQRAEVNLERRRVHRHQHVDLVARGLDVARAEVDLEGRHTEQGAGGRPDFGREVREGREIVAGQRGGQGELPAGQLHAVAGVACETNDDRVRVLNRVAVGDVFQCRCHARLFIHPVRVCASFRTISPVRLPYGLTGRPANKNCCAPRQGQIVERAWAPPALLSCLPGSPAVRNGSNRRGMAGRHRADIVAVAAAHHRT